MSSDALGSIMSGGGLPEAESGTAAGGTSGKATAALVLGIIGMLIVPVICSTLAIIFGAMAMGDTSRNPQLGGRGQAIAGLVLGIIGLVAGFLMLMLIFGSAGTSSSGY